MIKLKGLLKEAFKPETYYDTFSAAVQDARKYAESKGFEVDDDDWHSKITTGQGKPHGGKTTHVLIGLNKGGKPTRKGLSISVYNRDRPMADRTGPAMQHNVYELTTYIS